jgi:hypothetical protein
MPSTSVAAAVATAAMPVADTATPTAISVTGVNRQPDRVCNIDFAAATMDFAGPLR